MREIKLRIDPNPVHRHYFDVLLTVGGEESLLEKKTPEQIHNLMRSEINRALESMD